jgi:hypothetical protein
MQTKKSGSSFGGFVFFSYLRRRYGKYEDDATIQFIIEGNKLIPVGGNEVNDYFIKLVE